MRICPGCGKKWNETIFDMSNYVYKINSDYFCSYHCYAKKIDEINKKAQERDKRKNDEEMKKLLHRLWDEKRARENAAKLGIILPEKISPKEYMPYLSEKDINEDDYIEEDEEIEELETQETEIIEDEYTNPNYIDPDDIEEEKTKKKTKKKSKKK